MANKICTHCGYEGKANRPPSDHAGEDDSFIIGFFNKLFLLLTFIPIKFNFLARLLSRRSARHCPNCGLPLMVKLSSDAGWLAKRKLDIKAGLVVVGEKKEVVAFGREVVLPGDEKRGEVKQEPSPTNLPALAEMLEEAPAASAAPAPEFKSALAPAATKREKPVDPDQW
ncbi:MAG: hypothetical protein V4735_06790 [Pseudomonadota bacterium]